ncbi:MAG TPA: peptidase [Alphaproteobacteria bacterium]|nr:peptidase [Alphaproteobacteria bacterium]
MILSSIALLVFPLLMAFAASSDLLTMRISNRLVAILAAGFLVLAPVAGMPLQQVGIHAGLALIVLGIGFAFFALGWIGGGDAKLAAATTLWIGLGEMLPYLVYSALLGGVLTLAVLAMRSRPLPPVIARVRWIERLHDAKAGVPYGVALAAAGILVYAQTDIFRQLSA